MVAQVRRFNRAVTQRVGALDDSYLASGRPLGEARVLWEIGEEGCEVRALRSRLGLDSGHASRLLRSLEAAGLVEVAPGAADRRVRTARLTPAGLAERRELDRRSDELARSVLEPLPEAQRERLVGAMREVERLLTAALVEIRQVDPAHPDARHCLRSYFAELERRSGRAASTRRPARPPSRTRSGPRRAPPGRLPRGRRRSAAARSSTSPAAPPTSSACGWRSRPAASGSVAGSWPSWRRAPPRAATAPSGWRPAASSPRRSPCTRSAGYVEVPAFNDEPFADHWFEKILG